MKKLLFSVGFVLVIFGCGGDDADMPCLFCTYCGSRAYDAEKEFCFGSTLYSCGGRGYDPSTNFCSGSTIYSKCGGSDYDPSTNFCSGGMLYSCGGRGYDPSTNFCSSGMLYSCGGRGYDPLTHFCSGGTIYLKCEGSVVYTPGAEACCGSNKYTLATQICENNIVKTQCGSGWYNTITHFCYNNNAVEKCGTRTEIFNPALYECRDVTKIYLKTPIDYEGESYEAVLIGTQTWLARNLNYDVPNNVTDVCYDNNPDNCVTYGRLYNWATAMALPSDCNNSTCSSQIQSKHRGICPEGWHIPSNADWDRLYSSVSDKNTAGKHLKAASGWNSGCNGTDLFGFSALPGGETFSEVGFYGVGGSGLWHSASEDRNNDRDGSNYSCNMFCESEYAGCFSNFYKSAFISVRCLQD